MTPDNIRATFLKFFEEKGHTIVPSAPMVVKNDPTLMFTNAGMNQFKDAFLGTQPKPALRVVDSQKCLRVSGKHNDLEEVGHDTYHHTMFEMLGNWSFGDYFKKEAIEWAWELLTTVYKIDQKDLYITVFEGDKEDGTSLDQEAYDFWKAIADESHILACDKKDNFWEMGETGPCGPCSEIHIDLRSDEDKAKTPGIELVNADHPEVIELWNLVFIQYNRKEDKSLEDLPERHVDTGMGFERLCRVLEKKASNYDTGVFMPLMNEICRLTDKEYGKSEEIDIAVRVISDHIRAVAFCIADGQLPSNTGAGYVVRRILRRAVRYGYSYLNSNQPMLHQLVKVLAEQLKDVFPELHKQLDFVSKVVEEEERSFLSTLGAGIKKFNKYKESLKGKIIDGQFAFELYDTSGFPIDLTELLARENGLEVDIAGFTSAMKEQKDRSRAAATMETGDWHEISNEKNVIFLGYDESESDSKIIRYRTVKVKDKEQFHIVLDQTPFYAESGGQVGDKGQLFLGSEEIHVLDTRKENDLIIHHVNKLPSEPSAGVHAKVNLKLRDATASNHSVTHLLHAALRSVLGDHVEQKGSLVNPDHLRFDFSHFAKMEEEQIAEVEQIVNARIRQDIQLDERRNVPIEDAKALGAMALFGEKYGENVRVIIFNQDYSVELCGGIHVPSTGRIGLFKITSEGAIAAGVRRIEAITGQKAEEFVNSKINALKMVSEITKNPKDPVKGVESLVAENEKLRKQLESMSAVQVNNIKKELADKIIDIGGIPFLGARVEISNVDAIKDLAFALKRDHKSLLGVLGAEVNGKANITVLITDNLVAEKELDASKIIREVASCIQGGGGGQAFYATAGGKNPKGIEEAIEVARKMIESA